MFTISGSGRALPRHALTLNDLSRRHGVRFSAPDACPKRRHVIGPGETQLSLAREAALEALDAAGCVPNDIDMVLHAAAVPFQPIPATSAQLAAILDISDGQVEILDVNATCLSFLSALDIAVGAIARGRAQTVLIVSSEVPSRALPWKTAPETAALFGDGAAAFVLTRGTSKIRGIGLRSFPSAVTSCELAAGGTRFDYHNDPEIFADHSLFHMDGPALYKTTLRHMPRILDRVLGTAGWTIADVDTLIAHQASPAGLDHMNRILKLTDTQLVSTIHDTGNLVAASIPYGLATAAAQGRLHSGAKLMLAGTGAGLTIGAVAVEIGA